MNRRQLDFEITKALLDRFWSKVEVTDSVNDCWLWKRPTDKGYGLFNLGGGKMWWAHRLSYFFIHGKYDVNEQVRHTCDNPPCVNPYHLILGSQQDNIDDQYSRDRGLSYLTNEQIAQVRRLASAGLSAYEIKNAMRLNLPNYVISMAAEGKTGKHVETAPVNKVSRSTKQNKKISPSDALDIKRALQSPYWGQVSDLAKKYDVDVTYISMIKRGKVYANITV